MLNLVISIISDTFESVREREVLNSEAQRASLILELKLASVVPLYLLCRAQVAQLDNPMIALCPP